MMVRSTRRILSVMAVMLLAAPPLFAQESQQDPIDIFQKFSGKVWLGHYVDSETSHVNHVLRCSPILEGKAVRIVKKVPELNFMMETLCFWNPGEKTIDYVSLTNRGQLSKGRVSIDEGRVVFVGVSVEAGGNRDYKITMEARGDGSLEDRFFLKRDGQWHQGHLIQYNQTKEPEFVDLFK